MIDAGLTVGGCSAQRDLPRGIGLPKIFCGRKDAQAGGRRRATQAGDAGGNRSIRDQPLSRPHGASRVPAVGGATGGRSTHVRAGVPERGRSSGGRRPVTGHTFSFHFPFRFHFRFWCQQRLRALIEPDRYHRVARGLGAGVHPSREIRALEPAHPKRNPRLSPYAPTRFAGWLIDRARHGSCKGGVRSVLGAPFGGRPDDSHGGMSNSVIISAAPSCWHARRAGSRAV